MGTKTVSVQFDGDPSAAEWRSIRLFRRRAAEYQETLASLGVKEITIHMKRERSGGYAGRSSVPALPALKALVLDFRPFYLQGEPTNFHLVAKIVARHCRASGLRRFVADLRSRWSSTFVESGFFVIDEKKLLSSDVLDLWLNADIFHSSEEKEVRLDRLNEALGAELSRAALFMAVYDAGLAVTGLAHSIRDLTPEQRTVYVPTRYSAR